MSWLWRIMNRIGPAWTGALIWGSAVWAGSRVGVILTTYFGTLLNIPSPGSHPAANAAISIQDLLGSWRAWDVGWYLAVANQGYDHESMAAFFPLYPMLINVLKFAVPSLSPFVSAVVISNLALLAALVLLNRLTEREFGVACPGTTIVLMAYPAAFFFSTGYAESLLLALVLASLYALRAGRWGTAGALGAAAALTRPTGIVLLIPFVWEYVRQSPIRWRDIRNNATNFGWWREQSPALGTLIDRFAAVALIPFALALYAAYLGLILGNPLAFVTAHSAWHRVPTFPLETVILTVQRLWQDPLTSYVDCHKHGTTLATN